MTDFAKQVELLEDYLFNIQNTAKAMKEYQRLLELALEQKQDSDLNRRAETMWLLIDVYRSWAEWAYDEFNVDAKRLEKVLDAIAKNHCEK